MIDTPAPMPDPTPEATTTERPQYVGFWMRVVAGAIDLVAGALLVALVALIVDPPHFHGPRTRGLMDFTLHYMLPGVAILAFWFTRGATPGKLAISAEIVDADTFQAPTRGQFVLRYAAYYLSLVVILLGFAWIAFDARKQGWHDKIAGTVVVRRLRGRPVDGA